MITANNHGCSVDTNDYHAFQPEDPPLISPEQCRDWVLYALAAGIAAAVACLFALPYLFR